MSETMRKLVTAKKEKINPLTKLPRKKEGEGMVRTAGSRPVAEGMIRSSGGVYERGYG